MKRISQLLAIASCLLAFASSGVALAADENHDKWIDVLSIDWGAHKPGASTTMDDGNYKDKKGRYVIVRNGKVESRGWDYRKKEPIRGKATRTRPQGSRDVKTRDDDEEAALLLPAVQKVRDAARRSSSSETGPDSVQGKPQEGVEPDEIDVKVRARPEPQEGIEPDEIDNK